MVVQKTPRHFWLIPVGGLPVDHACHGTLAVVHCWRPRGEMLCSTRKISLGAHLCPQWVICDAGWLLPGVLWLIGPLHQPLVVVRQHGSADRPQERCFVDDALVAGIATIVVLHSVGGGQHHPVGHDPVIFVAGVAGYAEDESLPDLWPDLAVTSVQPKAAFSVIKPSSSSTSSMVMS